MVDVEGALDAVLDKKRQGEEPGSRQRFIERHLEKINETQGEGATLKEIHAALVPSWSLSTFRTRVYRARKKRQKRKTAKQATTQPKPEKKPAAAPQKRERQQPPEPAQEPEEGGETPAQIRQRLIENESHWDFYAAPERQQQLCRYRNQEAAQTEYLEPAVDDLPPPWSKQPFEPEAIDETWFERWSDRLTTGAKYTVTQLRKAKDWRDVHFALKNLNRKKRASVDDMGMVQNPGMRTIFEESKPLAAQRS